MSSTATQPTRNRIVLVVGIDLNDTTEHLLSTVKELLRGSDEAELHVVHVVPPETFNERLVEPVKSPGVAERTRAQIAQWEVERLCSTVVAGAPHVIVHTPAGRPVEELTRLATEVGADAIVVEAHDHPGTARRRLFHRSVAAGLAKSAPCSVLTVRAHHPVATTRTTPG
jgi:nucleotide-binding universal stress UspA family protein